MERELKSVQNYAVFPNTAAHEVLQMHFAEKMGKLNGKRHRRYRVDCT
jgi:hypothetical protein